MAFYFNCCACEISLLCFSSLLIIVTSFGKINSVNVINETLITDKNVTSAKLFLQLTGENLSSDIRIKPSVHVSEFGSECSSNELLDVEFVTEWFNDTSSVVSIVLDLDVKQFSKFASCVLNRTSDYNTINSDPPKWLNQGSGALFRTNEFSALEEYSLTTKFPKSQETRFRRALEIPQASSAATQTKNEFRLLGIRLEFSDPPAAYEDDGTAEPTLLVGSEARYRLFGIGWPKNITFMWTEKGGNVGDSCFFTTGYMKQLDGNAIENNYTAQLTMKIPRPTSDESSSTLYLCYREKENQGFIHLGSTPYTRVLIRERIIPLWFQIVIIFVCLSFSSLFSGLNLGLLSLNRTDLKIISNTGTETERRYAKAIYPVRIHGNYLLCSILLGNVLVNSIFTIMLDDLSSGIVAVVVSTLCIVICGEICPQAVCSRHGLAIGAKTIYITKAVMILTAPLAYPLSRLLDWILGEEIATTYTRERLKELVKVTTEYNDLEKDEVNIISGALELRKKTVGEVMTKIEDVYMLSYDTILDFETVTEIMQSGFSRIPVYEGTRRNIVSLLYIKDLALIDPSDNTPLKTLSLFYQNSCYYVFEDTTLDVVFKQFKDGCKGHMAFVHRVNNEGEGDPFYETVGIVTLEDVIEELIQAEIMDETDVYTDNRTKQRRQDRMRAKDLSLFAERREHQRIHISPQLNLAAFRFLSASVDAFKPDNISESVLLRLLKQDIIFHIKMKDKEKMKNDNSCIIYQQGKPADYFVLILEGRVEVTVGRENLMFESGPFTYFGSQALIPNIGVAESPTNVAQPMGSLQSVNLESMLRYTFIPDYTVRAVTEVFYIRIKRSVYLAAKKATLMEQSKKVSNAGEHFDDEVEKLLHNFEKGGNGDEDNKSQGSRDGSFSNQQNMNYIEDSARSSPVQTDSLNNGFISGTATPSRTPNTTEQTEEKVTLLGSTAEAIQDDRVAKNS